MRFAPQFSKPLANSNGEGKAPSIAPISQSATSAKGQRVSADQPDAAATDWFVVRLDEKPALTLIATAHGRIEHDEADVAMRIPA